MKHVSRETSSPDALTTFTTLLQERGVPLGLVAESDLPHLRKRHIEDSLRAAEVVSRTDRLLCDIGSGAGLPAIPIAIVRPDLRVVAIEPRTKAVGFLELALERLGLANLEVRQQRVDEVEISADLATTRAFAPLERSWAAAVRVLRPGGRLVYFAGAALEDPLARARDIKDPERPAAAELWSEIADFSPLVIMTRASGALDGRPGGKASTRG